MVSSCCNNSRLVSWDNGSIRVVNESTSWASGTYWDDTSGESVSWDWSNSWGSEWDCWSSNCWGSDSWGGDSWASYSWYTITITSTIGEYWGSGSIGSTSSGQMVGSGSNNGWGISWGDSTIWVSYQTGSTGWQSISKRTYVSCISDAWYGCKSWSWSSNGWNSTIDWSWGNGWYGRGGYKCWGMSSIDGTFGGQMVGSGSDNRWSISWSNSSIWVSY